MRTGYTTGACAAAAARAACLALLKSQAVKSVEIQLPGGQLARFNVSSCILEKAQARCSAIKDAGDDPDVTHGAEICASVRFVDNPGINIKGGEGVGKVTRPGLGLEVGSAAINPVPRQMILKSIEEAIKEAEDQGGLEVEISVPGGEKIAQRTLNPRLGIVGGISILGTTGIVIPYSLEAYKACITQSLDVAKACGLKEVILTSGRQSERYAQNKLSLPEMAYIQSGDKIAFTLRECARIGFSTVHLWGMLGKMSKIAAGYLNTHHTQSSIDLDFLCNLAKKSGAIEEDLKDIKALETAHEFLERAKSLKSRHFFDEICRLAAQSSMYYVKKAFSVKCTLLDYNGDILGAYG